LSLGSVLTNAMTGFRGIGTTYMPGRKVTWVTNP
jgi:hypothetical protein